MGIKQRTCARPGCSNTWTVGPRPHRTSRSRYCSHNCRARAHEQMQRTTPGQVRAGTVSIAEAARRLGLSRAAAYYNVRRGWIPTVRLGTERVPVAWLDRVLNQK